jgi:hypothetical protein
MGISMSGGGPFSYNRFDEYQRLIEKKQGYNDREDESLGERDGKESGKKQSEKDRRDEAKGEAKSEGKPDYIDIDKDGDKEESMKKAAKEAKNESMDLYVAALMRSMPSYLMAEKKDGEPTDERKEAADRGYEKKRQEKEGRKGEAHETEEIEKLEDEKLKKESFQAGYRAALTEGEGAGSPAKMVKSVRDEEEENKKETDDMKYDDKKQRRAQAKNAAEEYVMGRLMEDGLANNPVSAETIMLHMSDAWYDQILSEMGPAFPSETKAQAKAQTDHREGKSSKGLKTGKNPGLKMSHTSGYNKQD